MIVPKSGRELQGDGYEFTCGRHFQQQEPSRDGETVSGGSEFPVMGSIQAEMLLRDSVQRFLTPEDVTVYDPH